MAFSRNTYNPETNTYHSPRPPLPFPTSPSLSMLTFLFRNAHAHPHRLALADADSHQSLSFSQLRSSVLSLAAALQNLPIPHRSVILIFAPNSIPFALSFLAIIASGSIATTVNPLYTSSELSKQAQDSNTKLILTVPELFPKVQSLHLPTILFTSNKNVKFKFTSDAPIYYFSDLISTPEAAYVAPKINQSDTAVLLYSSGTTGASKGVVLTHQNFISASMMGTGDQDLRGDPPNVFLCFLPLFHVFGLAVIAYAQLQRGNSLVLMGRFEMEAMLRAIQRYRVTYTFVVPPVMIALAKQGRRSEYDLSSLKVLGSGAAPLGKDVMEEVARVFPAAEIIQVRCLFGGNWCNQLLFF